MQERGGGRSGGPPGAGFLHLRLLVQLKKAGSVIGKVCHTLQQLSGTAAPVPSLLQGSCSGA